MNDEQVRIEFEDRLEALLEGFGNEGYVISVVMELLEEYDISKVVNE